jgi:transposase
MNIRSLKKQGYSNRAIAPKTGLDKRTVKKYLNEDQLPVYKNVARQSKLDPYKRVNAFIS